MSGVRGDPDPEKAGLFEALSHPTRVRILQILARSPLGFSDLKREAGLESSGLLTFHLGKLAGLVEATEGSYALTGRGKEALGMMATHIAPEFPALKISCTNCGALMESYGQQAVRMGAYGETEEMMSMLVQPWIGTPVHFDTYVCPGCGKVEFFASRRTRKVLKGEFLDDDYFVTCPGCRKQYAKDIEKCPYCGEISPRFKTKP